MIPVVCAECGETFEIGDEFAGAREFCPACGTLNDIPNPDVPPPDVPALEIAALEKQHPAEIDILSSPVAVTTHGIPAALWWTILLGGIALFFLICVYLLSDNWESRNIQLLSDATNHGDVLMTDEDYAGAAHQYRFVLDTVGHRTIDSAFIQRLLDRARRGEIEANNRLHSPQPQTPQTQPTTQTQPTDDVDLALKSFQRDFETFPAFIRQHPVIFQDDKGNWRRRRFFVWQTAYDEPAPSASPKILLKYNCASNITEPHPTRDQAALDDNFTEDESPREIHCQTHLQWSAGHWTILHHDAEVQHDTITSVNSRPSLDEFYSLEREAFHARWGAQ